MTYHQSNTCTNTDERMRGAESQATANTIAIAWDKSSRVNRRERKEEIPAPTQMKE